VIFTTQHGNVEVVKDVSKGLFGRRVKLSTAKRTPPQPLHFDLVPTIQHVETKESHLDDNGKIMTAFVNRVVSLNIVNAKCFEDVQSIFNTHAGLVIRLRETIPRHKIFSKDDTKYFDYGDTPSREVIHAMGQWIATDLIPDREVVKMAGLDNPFAITSLLTFAGSHIMTLLSGIYSKDIEEKDLFDVGIIQYPDATSHMFRLRRIKLYVWAKRISIGAGSVKWTESGIRGEFITYIYEKNTEGIHHLSADQREKILMAFHDMANQLPGTPVTTRPTEVLIDKSEKGDR